MEKVEFAIRELAVAIDHLIDEVENDPHGYDVIPDSLHHAVTALMYEINAVDWSTV